MSLDVYQNNWTTTWTSTYMDGIPHTGRFTRIVAIKNFPPANNNKNIHMDIDVEYFTCSASYNNSIGMLARVKRPLWCRWRNVVGPFHYGATTTVDCTFFHTHTIFILLLFAVWVCACGCCCYIYLFSEIRNSCSKKAKSWSLSTEALGLLLCRRKPVGAIGSCRMDNNIFMRAKEDFVILTRFHGRKRN